MRLNHLDIPVADVAATRHFFEAMLGFRHLQTVGADEMAILTDESGFVLVLNRLVADDMQAFPRDFHIGFLQKDEQSVRDLHEKFTASGLESVSRLVNSGNSSAFYFAAPGNIKVEISWRT